MKIIPFFVLTLQVGHVALQGLLQNFVDFAALNTPTEPVGADNSTEWDWMFPPDSAFPSDITTTDTPIPADIAGEPFDPFSSGGAGPVDQPSNTAGQPDFPFPPDTQGPTDSSSSGSALGAVLLPGDSSGSASNAPGQNSQNAGTDNTFPTFDVQPTEQSLTKAPVNLDFHFLPSMPSGDKFVDLRTGNTNTFEPTSNWFVDSTGINTAQPTAMPPTVSPNNGQGVQPIVGGGGGKPAGVFPPSSSDLPIDNAKPLGPVIGQPVDLTPQEPKQPNGQQENNKGGVPENWMQLYPDGRPERPVKAPSGDAEAAPLTETEFWLAQNTLNSFSKNRRLSKMYRQERRRKAKQQRQQRKQERQQNKNKNKGRGNQIGRQGARVATMVLPGTNIPFVGKNTRGRRLKVPCTRLRKRRGLCDPGTALITVDIEAYSNTAVV